MEDKTAIILVNYNMPERTMALVDRIKETVETPYQLVVVDNGSNLTEPAPATSLYLSENVQTCNGWIMGVNYADALAKMSGNGYLAYWFLITSAAIPTSSGDVLSPLVSLLKRDDSVVGAHPALTNKSTTAWTHLKQRSGKGSRRVWMIDNIASLWRADFYHSKGGFDPRMIYAWGPDLELSYQARRTSKKLLVNEANPVEKITDIGYKLERMEMSALARRELAAANMEEILKRKYGPNWERMMRQDYVYDDLI